MFKKKSIDLSLKSEISASNVMSIFLKKYVSFKFELILATYFPKIAIVVLIHSSNRRNIREYIFPVLSFKFFCCCCCCQAKKSGKSKGEMFSFVCLAKGEKRSDFSLHSAWPSESIFVSGPPYLSYSPFPTRMLFFFFFSVW